VECRFPHAVGVPGPKELPFNDAWFAPASKTNPPQPRRGKLDLTNCVLKRKLHAAVREAENLRKGQQTPYHSGVRQLRRRSAAAQAKLHGLKRWAGFKWANETRGRAEEN
jgi:hypothetical protein